MKMSKDKTKIKLVLVNILVSLSLIILGNMMITTDKLFAVDTSNMKKIDNAPDDSKRPSTPCPEVKAEMLSSCGISKLVSLFCRVYEALPKEASKEILFTSLTHKTLRCVIETVENVFKNQYQEIQGSKIVDKCLSDGSVVKKGTICKGGPYDDIQDYMKNYVLAVLTLFIIFTGIKVFAFGQAMPGPQLAKIAIQICFIIYLSLGQGWKEFFVDAILKSGSAIGAIVLEASSEASTKTRAKKYITDRVITTEDLKLYSDKCNFKKIGPSGEVYNYKSIHYKLWDIIDCKMVNYLGYYVKERNMQRANFPALYEMAGAAVVLAPYVGLTWLFCCFVILFMTLSIVLYVLYAYLSTIIKSIILVFLTPLLMPTVLFSQTKSIYDSWLKQLVSSVIYQYMVVLISSFTFVLLDGFFYKGIQFDPSGNVDLEYRFLSSLTYLYSLGHNDPGYGYGIYTIWGVAIPYISPAMLVLLVPVLAEVALAVAIIAYLFSKMLDIAASLSGTTPIVEDWFEKAKGLIKQRVKFEKRLSRGLVKVGDKAQKAVRKQKRSTDTTST